MVGGRSLWSCLKWVLPDWGAQVSGTCSALSSFMAGVQAGPWCSHYLLWDKAAGTLMPSVNYWRAGRPTGEENRPYLHADQWLKGQRLQPHGLQWVNLLLPRLTTRSGRQPAHLKPSMQMAASNLIKGILVGGYSFAFLKQGCYSFFSSCWQKLCGSGDLNAALTSQHFKEQSVSDIP